MTTPTIALLAHIERFSQQLSELQTALGTGTIADDPQILKLQTQALSLQRQFQGIIAIAAETAFSPEIEPQFRPCLTEMNRLVRLIGIDTTFLRSARAAQTVQSRRAQLAERLQQLQALCRTAQAVLAQQG